jgi:hypothetical protein
VAQSTIQPNNRAVKFRGQGAREMASPNKLLTSGETVPKAAKIAKPSRVRQRARMRAKKAAKRGLISESAMKKHLGDY